MIVSVSTSLSLTPIKILPSFKKKSRRFHGLPVSEVTNYVKHDRDGGILVYDWIRNDLIFHGDTFDSKI